MRILVCGDRHWGDKPAIEKELKRVRNIYGTITVVHGAAKGADTIGGIVAKELGLPVEEHPADWKRYGRAAGPIRNREMLDSGLDVVLAFHDSINESKGTRDMVTIARKAGLPTLLFTSSSKESEWNIPLWWEEL